MKMRGGECWLCGCKMKMPTSIYCGAVCDGPKGWRLLRYKVVNLFRISIR